MKANTAVDILKPKRKRRKKKYWYIDELGQRRYASNLKELPYKVRKARIAKRAKERVLLTEEEKLARRQARHEATLKRNQMRKEASKRLTALRRQRKREEKLAEHQRLLAERKKAREAEKARKEAERYAKMSPRGKKMHDWWKSEKGKKRKEELREFYKTYAGKERIKKMQQGRARKRLEKIAQEEREQEELEPIGYGTGISTTSDIIELILKEIDDIPTMKWYSKGEFIDTEQWKERFRNIIDFNIASFGEDEYSNYLEKFYNEIMCATFVIQVDSYDVEVINNLALIERILTAGELSKTDNINATEASRAMEQVSDIDMDRNFLRKAGINW